MWGAQAKNKGDEASDELRKGDMPPWFYLPTHPEAKLTDNQVKPINYWFRKNFWKRREVIKMD